MSQPLDPQDDAVASDGDVSSVEGGRRIAPREARELAAQKRRSAKADAREEAANARAQRREAEAQRKRDVAAAASAKVQREDEERALKAAAEAEAKPVEQPVEPAPRRQSSVKTAGELAAEADRRDQRREEQARAEKEKADAAPAEVESQAPESGRTKPDKPVKVPKPPRERGAHNDRGWQIAATVVGVVGLLCSVILAAGALLVALGADQNGGIVGVVADICDVLVGPLKGLFTFSGANADLKAALVAWGLGSMIYLLVSRLLQSLLSRQVRDH